MNSKTNSKTPAVVVTGEAIPSDAFLFVRPSRKADREQAGAENIGAIRDAIVAENKASSGMLNRLVFALVLNPETSTDDKGRTVDALTALTTGDGALTFPDVQSKRTFDVRVSQARAANLLRDKAGIASDADPRWAAILQVTGRAGVGADRVTKFLEGRGQQRVLAALEGIGEARGAEKDKAIRNAFPSKRTPDDGTAGSKAFQQANKALDALNKAVKIKPADGGMSPEEQATLSAALQTIAEGLVKNS